MPQENAILKKKKKGKDCGNTALNHQILSSGQPAIKLAGIMFLFVLLLLACK